ncbi:COG4223 family protein [Telmatospirillum siberiense]|uniref:Mitochondrial inner membrane protein n=1 Tax=Telmatospirillum siberiense TaxID=382514 RepID=A0A2N3PWL9_9PROT|nr:mitofilin family membrane protein [Telmatospirillum siberiense]PKU24781.1 hypothetical protein CWS72_09285 [Telmatospirillum siberiense]
MTEIPQDAPASLSPATTGEPAVEPPADRKPPPSPVVWGFLGGLFGGIVVFVAAIGGLAAAWPDLREAVFGDEPRRLTTLEHAIDDLNPRLAAVERELNRRNGEADATGLAQTLAQKVAALETQVHAPLADARVGSLAERSDRQAADLSRLTADVQSLRGAIPPEGTILRLAERAELAEKAVRDIATQRASAQAVLLTVGLLRDAVNRGDPFTFELQATRKVLADQADTPPLEALAPLADKGIARKETLRNTWPEVEKAILRSAVLAPDGNFWERALYKVTTLVNIRKIDGQGTGTQAIVARAETRIGESDLAKAVEELSHLDGAPADAASAWLKAAKDRVAADRALSELSAASAAQSTRNGN